MKYPTNFSQLKKYLTEGTKLKVINSHNENHPFMGMTREVIKQQTNAIKFDNGSWMGMGSTGETAKNFEFTPDGFIFRFFPNEEKYKHEFIQYKFIK